MDGMELLQSIVLGLVQGLTEFIPVSSSGHLVVAQTFFDGFSDHYFLEWVNVGTFVALLVYFRTRIASIIRRCIEKRDYRLVGSIMITALPAGIVGFLLSDIIDSAPFFASIITVTVTLFVVGVFMIVLEKLPKASPMVYNKDLTWKRALFIGLVQVLALIPGVSRSGSTIIAGRLAGFNAKQAAEYSFLVSLPIMLGVSVKLALSAADRDYFAAHMVMVIVSNIIAFASGLVAVGFLMRYLAKHSLALFGWYRVGLASILAVVLLVQYVMN